MTVSKKFARWRYQLDVRQQIHCLIKFIRMRHRGLSLLSMIDLLSLKPTFLCIYHIKS